MTTIKFSSTQSLTYICITIFAQMKWKAGLCSLLFVLCGMQGLSSVPCITTSNAWYRAVARHIFFVVVHMYTQLPAVWFLSKKGLKIRWVFFGFVFLHFLKQPVDGFRYKVPTTYHTSSVLFLTSYVVSRVWKESIKVPISWQKYRQVHSLLEIIIIIWNQCIFGDILAIFIMYHILPSE